MKRLLVVIGVLLIVAALAYARAPKDYQVTGPVLEMDGDHIIVQKGKDEKWELSYDKDTKVTGGLEVDSKVTVTYLLKATSIDAKEEPKKAEPTKK